VNDDLNIYLRLTRDFNAGRPRALLAGGQAVVLYRLAMMSKDGDWVLREDEEALSHVLGVLAAHGACYRFGAPLALPWMRGGWSAHFEFPAEGLRIRTDFVTRPPRLGLDVLGELWRQEDGHSSSPADAKLGALLIGPGLSHTQNNQAMIDAALASRVPMVVDAGALGLVTSESLKRAARTILTPHEGEFVRLFGQLCGSKIDRARSAAAQSDATVIFKGPDTVIASPDGRVTLAPSASPWLATAGTDPSISAA
jgi:hypothetical protein